jgi:hypothetical protein
MLWGYDGSVVAWGWLQLPNALDFAIDPALPDLANAVLTWAEDAALSDRLSATVLETETHLIDALERRGFQAVGGPFYVFLFRRSDDEHTCCAVLLLVNAVGAADRHLV